MSDRGSIDSWRRDQDNDPRKYNDIASPEFAEAEQQEPQQRPRRKSILRHPERPSRAPRQDSQVRLQTSDDEGSAFPPVRKPPIGDEAARLERKMASRHDAERKDGVDNRRFRAKRDGYESDEGDTLRRGDSNSDPPMPRPKQQRRREYDDDIDDGYDPRSGGRAGGRGGPPPPPPPSSSRRDPRDPRDVDRRDPRDVDPRDLEPRDGHGRSRAPPVQYGDAPLPSRARVGGDPRDYRDGPPSRDSRRADAGRDSARGGDRRGPRRYEDDDDDVGPPRRSNTQRDPGRRDRRDLRGDYDKDGYRSGEDMGRRRGPRYDDYYSDGDHARGSNRNPRYYEDDRRNGRRDSYGVDSRRDRGGRDRGSGRDRGDRYRDDRYRDDDPRDRNGRKKSGNDLQTAAQAAFASYAMPIIKKEGTKFLRKQMQQFMASQGK